MVLKKCKDHWAFLDEIEAPMWVDLTLEDAKYNSQCIDDEWFYTSHPFHRCSSRQLKAAFYCSGERSFDLDFELLGPSSPKLPCSVSKSRGKDYKSKKWRGESCDVSLNKSHPVNGLREKSTVDVGMVKKIISKPSFVRPNPTGDDSKSCEQLKPKLSFINSKGTSTSKRSLVYEGSSTQNGKGNSLKTISSSRGLQSSSNSAVDKANESNIASTVTSESSLQGHQNTIEVSSRAFGRSSMLLSAVRITLRKSCVTRQASRVETNNDKRQSMVGINNDRRESSMEISGGRKESRDCNSSSSKSSVGSSSVPCVNSSTFLPRRKKEKTPDSRNVARMTEEPSNQVKVSNMSEVSIIQNKEGNINSRRENISTITKSTYKETAKLKLQSRTIGAKSSQPLKVNKQNSVIGDTKMIGKVGSSGLNRLVAAGKENVMRKMSNSQKCSGRENAAGGVVRDQNRKQQNVTRRGMTRILAGQQQGKISNQSDRKSLVCANQRVHLR